MNAEPDVAKLAQEASDKIVALYVNGPYDRERIVGFIQSAFSPALTALQQKLEAADLRINQLETECGHKEATIGELQQRLATVEAN